MHASLPCSMIFRVDCSVSTLTGKPTFAQSSNSKRIIHVVMLNVIIADMAEASYEDRIVVVLCFMSMVNSFGHVGTVS